MLRDNKNLKDSIANLDIAVRDTDVSLSYNKTNKLITALYMVTDIMDKEEPIRSKLRHLGIEIILDIHSSPIEASTKIDQTVSFLDIASAINLISGMNCGILKKEFFELKKSISEHTQIKHKQSNPVWLEEFLLQPNLAEPSYYPLDKKAIRQSVLDKRVLNGQPIRTRIGVQKGSTLMQALSDKTNFLSYNNATHLVGIDNVLLKKERQGKILYMIRNNGGSATIKDIKDKLQNLSSETGSVSFSEKTLQRELLSMVRDGVLNKTGEKRWSRYQLAHLPS